ncbi:MAG: hypothetical protein JO125_03495 [Chloroflexi bacterium]|nr:hypothetical protein [Chloroflexota bacterium]
MKKEQLISEMLLLPGTALDYHIGQNLAKLFPDRALIEGDAFNFNVRIRCIRPLHAHTPALYL